MDEVDSFAAVIAVLVAPDHELQRPVFDPRRLLRDCRRSGERSGLLVAKAIELFGPVGVRDEAERVVAMLEEAVTPEERELVGAMGRVEPVEAIAMTDAHHDATALHLRARRPSGEEIGVRVICEAGFRGAATAFGYGFPLSAALDHAGRETGMIVEEVSLADARVWFEHALHQRDVDFEPDPDDEDEAIAAEHRAIVAHYFRQCPEGGRLPARARLATADDVPALVAEFVASPFSEGLDEPAIAAEQLAAFGMSASGRPLWWSPIVAEIFAHYAPQVFGPEAMTSLAPAAKAWTSWAGERLGKTPQAISETRRAIDTHAAARSRPRDERLVLPGLEPAAGSYDEDEGDDWLLEAWTRHESRVADFVRNSLETQRGVTPPELSGLADAIRRGVAADEWPYSTLAALSQAIGRRLSELTDTDVVLWAASVMMDPDPQFDDPQPEADDIDAELLNPLTIAGAMDPIDWATVIVGLSRAGPGASCDPEALAEIIAELSDEADDDIELLETFFEMNRSLWRAAGVTDADDNLTEVGAWALPRGLSRTLGVEFD